MSLYSDKLVALKKEVSEIEKKQRGKYSFKENQQKVYDFILGRKDIVQFEINGEQYFMKRGDGKKGFEHILRKHYGEECEGAITARDILNISNVIQNGRPMTDVELKNGNIGYIQIKNGLQYKVILGKEANGNLIISLFSNKEEKGDCS